MQLGVGIQGFEEEVDALWELSFQFMSHARKSLTALWSHHAIK